MKKIFILSFMATFFAKFSSAQFNIEDLSFGASAGYHSFLSDVGGGLAADLRGHYYMSERNALNVGFGLQAPLSLISEDKAHPYDLTNPNSISVQIEQSIRLYRLFMEYNFYFVGDMDENFGVFGIGGIGLTAGQAKVRMITDYDKTVYRSPIENSQSTLSGPTINLGIGASYNFTSKLAGFVESRICLPANSHGNGMAIINDIPFNYGIGFGIRFNPFYQESDEEEE